MNIQILGAFTVLSLHGNFQGKGSNSIEQTSLRLQTDTQNNMSFLKKTKLVSEKQQKPTKLHMLTH